MGKGFMILLRSVLLFSLLFVAQSIFANICVNTTSNYKMFGSVLKADVLKNPFIMAFRHEHFKNYQIFFASNNTLLTDQIQSMTKNNCSVILGLFTSQDCLVSGPILKKNKVIALSSSCSENHIANFLPYVYTAVPRLSEFSQAMADYVNRNNDIGTIYVFYQPSDVYSSSGFKAFQQYVSKPIKVIAVDLSGNYNLKAVRSCKDQVATFIFFTYPLPSVQILVSLDAEHIITNKINVMGASAWIFDVSVFKPIKSILQKAKSVLTPSLADQKRINSSVFAQEFIQKYSREPDIVEVLTYDVSRLAVQCYKHVLAHGGYTNNLFLSCLRHNRFKGLSGYYTFRENSPFVSKNIYLINFLSRI